MISNTLALKDLHRMPIGEIATLPADQLALLQVETDEALRAAKATRDWLEGAIAQRYADRAQSLRRDAGKNTGTIRFDDGPVIVVADLPKKVDWDQTQLAARPGRAHPRRRGRPHRVRRHRLQGSRTQVHRLARPHSFGLRECPHRAGRQTLLPTHPEQRGVQMTAKTKLDRLREDNCFLADIPDSIRIPALGDRQEEVIKPIEAASIDDIAFAQLALQAKSSALYAEIDALRRIYDMARKNGAVGADNALDAIAKKQGGK